MMKVVLSQVAMFTEELDSEHSTVLTFMVIIVVAEYGPSAMTARSQRDCS